MNDEAKRILVMEDSDIFADLLTGLFDSTRYVIERAVNGFEGIKKVYSFLPHLIITDIEMPLFKGYQVTRLLKSRKNTKTIPVIMFTSLDETKDKFWGNQAGADIYIEKSPDNFQLLLTTVENILYAEHDIDFSAIERESKKITDNSIIEIVNNLLDNKLFQTTVIGLLTELSNKVFSMDMVASGIFDLLHTICEAEIITMMIRGKNRLLYVYTANYGGFTNEITGNFQGISLSDFNNQFPDFKFSVKNTKDFHLAGRNQKKITSYISLPLTIAGEKFASIYIANSINEYFSPVIMENINVFAGAAAPVIANALSMHELEELQKNTRIAFAHYVPADVMDDIISETTNKNQMSENRIIAVLFSDIRDFTRISEHSDAQSVVDFLNLYFSKMGSEIISEGGHIDKFIGDAIMALFGAFQNMESSPSNAIRAAVKMLAAIDEINSLEKSISHNNINIGIGINYGECILGNIGFQNKMDYTIIGDTVNLASRIEGLTKRYHHPLIVSENVYEATKNNYLLRKIENVRVMGKEKQISIYAVYSGFKGSGSSKLRSGEIVDLPTVPSLLIDKIALVNYNKGLQVFYMREWKLAQEYFKKALEADNNDYLSKMYLDRAVEFEHTPPGNDWDGVITLDEK
ncbi:MAG: response regulator [Treponema sp.]|jgi:class 3 adenylate cyclase/CheY-like chemotaxis protein|nr:response regulator [Treponema sp.]